MSRELTDHDRAVVREFRSFLRAVGPLRRKEDLTAEEQARRKAWILADPDARLEFLGLTREWAREHGYDL